MRRLLTGVAAAVLAGGSGPPPPRTPGPHALADLAAALVRVYNDDDAAELHGLLAPSLQARHGLGGVRATLTLCRVLTGEILRVSTPSWGARTYGFFGVYAESKVFEMILEIDPDGRIVHLVITDDVTAEEQQCRIGGS